MRLLNPFANVNATIRVGFWGHKFAFKCRSQWAKQTIICLVFRVTQQSTLIIV